MTDHVFTARNVFRGWLVALALGSVWLSAHAQGKLTRSGATGHTWVGNGTTYSVGDVFSQSPSPPTFTYQVPPGTEAASTIRSFGSGADASGNPQASTRANYEVPGGGGRKVPLDVKTPLSKPSAGAAISKFAFKLAVPLTTGMAIYDLLNDLGVLSVWKPDDSKNVFHKLRADANCDYSGTGWNGKTYAQFSNTTLNGGGACTISSSATGSGTCEFGFNILPTVGTPKTSCQMFVAGRTFNAQGTLLSGPNYVTWATKPLIQGNELGEELAEEQLANEIANKSGWPTAYSRALADAVKSGVAGVDASGAPSTVTTPQPSTAGETKQQTETVSKPGPDGTTIPGVKTTTTNTTYNTTTNGPSFTITNNTTSTSVTNYNDGTSTTSTTNNSSTTPTETPVDPCEANPDRAGCVKLGEPDEPEIPKTTKELTYTPEEISGGGSCPPDIVRSIGGQSITVFRYAPGCDLVSSYLRPMVLMISAFIAFMILVPGGRADT